MLPRFYKDEPAREREVALFIDGKYVTRGPASVGRRAARSGYPGLDETVPPSRLTWQLDTAAHEWMGDKPCLMWGGENITSQQFLTWLEASA